MSALSPRLRLGVNIDHVATLRNARGGASPDPTRAADLALGAGGADGITAHLREDRRHIRESDLAALTRLTRDRDSRLNLEIAAVPEMIEIAVRHRPHAVCLVPERREERTTEGGLDVAGRPAAIASAVERLRGCGARVSLFIEPTATQVAAAQAAGAQVVELHTGAYCEATAASDPAAVSDQLARLVQAAADAAARGLEVHAGHGLDFANVSPVAAITEVVELNIGHFLIGEAVFTGLPAAIVRMRGLMDAARLVAEPAA